MDLHLERMRVLSSTADDPVDAIRKYTCELDVSTVQALVARLVRLSAKLPPNKTEQDGTAGGDGHGVTSSESDKSDA
jgi:hypothetical protein